MKKKKAFKAIWEGEHKYITRNEQDDLAPESQFKGLRKLDIKCDSLGKFST